MPQPPNQFLPPVRAKQRTARIATGYLGRPSALESWKVRLTALAAVAAAVWIGFASLGGSSQRLYSRGPVAHAHAMWENNCQTCHVDFTPISGSAGGIGLAGWSHASDAKCQQCHAGPTHHAVSQLANDSAGVESANCATCHVDHRGRDASLVRVADKHCTACHSDLPHDLRATSKFDEPIANVEAFTADLHPSFRSLRQDPGRLKFNHAMHMTAGLMHAANGRQSFGIADMPEEFQQRYKKVANEKGQIQLNCESCHELDRTNVATLDGLPGAIGVPRGTGEYYRPVVYEQHCQACHSLPYRPGGGNSPDAHVQHRLNAKQLETRVRDVLLTQLVRETPELQDLHRETIPGNEPPDLLTDTGRAWLEAELNQSAHYLKTAVCAECHETAAMDAMPSLFPDVSTTNVPNVWLKHARFDHSAHRAVACVECHARAYSDKADASRLAKDVLVPNIESCVRCHAPRQDFNGQLIGGARHDCVECHLYHGRDDPNHWLDGKGSVLRGAKARRSIDQLLEQSMPGNDLEP